MAGYVDSRQRTLLGAIRRRRRLLGQDDTTTFYSGASAAPMLPSGDFYAGATAVPGGGIIAPDLTETFAPTSTLFPTATGPSIPTSFFAPSKPVIPAPTAQPAPTAPTLTKTFPGLPNVQVVLPSQGSVARALAPTSFFDQQMIAGVPNSYLLVGAAAIGLVALLGSRKRRRR